MQTASLLCSLVNIDLSENLDSTTSLIHLPLAIKPQTTCDKFICKAGKVVQCHEMINCILFSSGFEMNRWIHETDI